MLLLLFLLLGQNDADNYPLEHASLEEKLRESVNHGSVEIVAVPLCCARIYWIKNHFYIGSADTENGSKLETRNNVEKSSMNDAQSSTPITTGTSAAKPRRGRRSLLPPEQREQTRRLKKQNMERRRRACISDKMTALHNLAMEIIGVDPQTQLKIEKADILSTCHLVFEEVAEIARGDPAFQERLGKIRSQISISTHSAHPLVDENTQSSAFSDEGKENSSILPDIGNSHRSVDHSSHELKSFESAKRPGHSTPHVFFRTRGNSLTSNDSGMYSFSPDQTDEKPAHSSSLLTSTTGWSAINHTRPTYLKTHREGVTVTTGPQKSTHSSQSVLRPTAYNRVKTTSVWRPYL
ncbi:hypothetical protein PHET_01425 [Paragonimus heterotremus]|uniref:BHLH domain-containing protein n=1 Tax=Paragonimus heterotremus TaxID=100268 RepID=A0A8J4STM7_9TREM|nr:hypothetical protein PHET_01425 [Paragonimus heterotremus]